MKLQTINDDLSWRLDMARSLAALAVLCGHVRNDYFVAYGNLITEFHNPLNFLGFLLTRLGHEAVMVFFVLSGFLVGGNALKSYMNGEFQFTDYLSKRITRMYVVIIPALLIGGCIDVVRLHITGIPHPNLTLLNLIGNLLFLQKIVVEIYGSNAPLWSLANEFWYYLLWPIVFQFFNLGALKKILVISIITIACYIAPNVMKLFPLWIFGALLRLVPRRYIPSHLMPLSLWLFVLAAIYSCWVQNIIGEYVTGIFFGLLLACWMGMHSPPMPRIAHFWTAFAAFSFSLYAIHYPLLKLLIELMNKYGNLNARNTTASLTDWLFAAGIACIIIFFSWLFYICFERNTNFVRARLKDWIKTLQNASKIHFHVKSRAIGKSITKE